MNDNNCLQFEGCRFRGYDNEDGTPKNPLSDKAFHIAFEEYTSRNTERVARQKERKLKKQKKLAMKEAKKKEKEERKKDKADKAMMRSGVKKKRHRGDFDGVSLQVKKKRVECSAKLCSSKDNGEVHSQFVKDKENIAPIQRLVNKTVSIQMSTFNDRRVTTEEFLRSLEEKC